MGERGETRWVRVIVVFGWKRERGRGEGADEGGECGGCGGVSRVEWRGRAAVCGCVWVGRVGADTRWTPEVGWSCPLRE